jgi:hypothetical protein
MKFNLNKFIYWSPRILGVIFILFLALFSLDVFESGLTYSQIALGLLMHNIPSLILLGVLMIAWKKNELAGAIVFNLAGFIYVILTITNGRLPWYIVLSWSLTIAGPAFLIGILFLINWLNKRKLQVT